MAFLNLNSRPAPPDSPQKLFLEFSRRRFPTVLPHQSFLIERYVQSGQRHSDVALQLPTGSGKTLVGLLIAEWLLRKNRERVVYLCPTRQLVNQVVEQATDDYGMAVRGFTGKKQDYDPAAKADYANADKVAVTTYNSLFNSNPYFTDPSVILVDDAHAAENYFASMWSVRISRDKPQHQALHAALVAVLSNVLDSEAFTRISGEIERDDQKTWVDKLPTPRFRKIIDEVRAILDAHHDADSELQFAWQETRPILHACNFYLGSNELLIRPFIPPTWRHEPFTQARQRMYMSATLGAGGDLERVVGRKNIVRLPMPDDFPTQSVGRRFFIFPELALKEPEVKPLRHGLMKLAGRSLVLVPSDGHAARIQEEIKDELRYPVFSSRDIEGSTKPFVQSPQAVAVVAGRYDGIDFPEDECRLLFLNSLPRATNLQEKFFMSRMGANALYNERILTRVLQAVGRCTRSLLDFSAVVVDGGDLAEYLANPKLRRYFSPELQAEIDFGMEQSRQPSAQEILENVGLFLANGPEWQQANNQILDHQKKLTREQLPLLAELAEAAPAEVDYQERLCRRDFEEALECAERVLGALKDPSLKGYRALWHYFAGSAALMAAPDERSPFNAKAKEHFRAAKKAAAVHWLADLAKGEFADADESEYDSATLAQIERVETKLEGLGTLHEGRFAALEKKILEGLRSLSDDDSVPFETAQLELGKLLGFDCGKEETTGSPDPWWGVAGKTYLIFEDHAAGKDQGCLFTNKARQAMSHPDWLKRHVAGAKDAEVISVVVTPAKRADEGAKPILHHFYVWPLDEYIRGLCS